MRLSQVDARLDGRYIDGRQQDMCDPRPIRALQDLIKVGLKLFEENVGVRIDQHGVLWVHSIAGRLRSLLRCVSASRVA